MTTTGDILGDTRHIVDPDGEPWKVYELSGVGYDRRRSLIFEGDGVIRRVRGYPTDWRSLADEELYRLSWRP